MKSCDVCWRIYSHGVHYFDFNLRTYFAVPRTGTMWVSVSTSCAPPHEPGPAQGFLPLKAVFPVLARSNVKWRLWWCFSEGQSHDLECHVLSWLFGLCSLYPTLTGWTAWWRQTAWGRSSWRCYLRYASALSTSNAPWRDDWWVHDKDPPAPDNCAAWWLRCCKHTQHVFLLKCCCGNS